MCIILRYKDGHNVGTPEFTPPAPTRLQWDLSIKCIEAIEQSYQVIIINFIPVNVVYILYLTNIMVI